jgi:NAD(P)-dependent dehydrogenase (short-subunit alcohol dehydrogenase family)
MTKLKVLVTGGGRGIGRAIALRFAREGAAVTVAARTSSEIDKVAEEITKAGGRGMAANMNVADHGSVEAAVWRAVEFMGGLDVLVNNAGVFDVKRMDDMRPQDWQFQMDVNLNGPFLVALECLDHLKESERAHVINIASHAARRGFAGNTAYCASKYGLRGFGDALREELKEGVKRQGGVRVTTVYAPSVDTTIFEGVEGNWDRSKMLKPEDVAEAVWRAVQTPVDDLVLEPKG